MLESKAGIMLIAGLAFFGLAFVSNALVPALLYQDLPELTAEQLVNGNLRYQFEDLARRYPDSFEKAYGKPPEETNSDEPKVKTYRSLPQGYGGAEEIRSREDWFNWKTADALRLGRKVYVGEGCWHCHSQFVRPVSNEEQRWGPVSKSIEYQNELQRPVMFGTRRVGPDLCREGGRRSNDWHAVHFFKPTSLSEGSPMPSYPWFFDGSPDKPTERGLAIITYVQWLGSWQESYPYYEQFTPTPIAAEKPAAKDE